MNITLVYNVISHVFTDMAPEMGGLSPGADGKFRDFAVTIL